MPCRMTKRKMSELGLEYEEIGVDTSKDLDTVEMLRSFGYRSFPVVIVEGYPEVIVGYAPNLLEKLTEVK